MTYRTIKQTEPDWRFIDGLMLVPRATLEISELCPDSMKFMIHRAMTEGYLKLVAHVPDQEYMWEKLKS